MSETLVSIGIPCHNAARYLGEAIASALAQSYRHIELIIYDDASSDDTPSLLRTLDDPRLILFRGEENLGVAAARQYIKEHARGDYLAWLDADDRFDPERIEILLHAGQTSGADLVIDSARLVDEAGQHLPGVRRVPDSTAADPYFTRIFERNTMLPHPLISRRCYSRIDFDTSLTTSEDYDYWLRCSFAGFIFARVDRVLMDYRIAPGSLSSDPAASREAVARILEKHPVERLEALYRERGISEEATNYMVSLQWLFRGAYRRALERAQRPWPDEPNADRDFYVGTLALQCGDNTLAETHLHRHLKTAEASPAGLNNMGVLMADRGNDGTAYWEEALGLFPHYTDARNNLAGNRSITLTQLPTGRPR